MTTIKVIKVVPNDIEKLQKIGKQTFNETFSDQNTAENMSKYLDEKFSIKKLTTELNDDNAIFYFAAINTNIIGYLKLNSGKSQTEIQDNKGLEIERIYVTKEYQGKKVGQILCNKALEIAKLKKSDYVWLGVWEENINAINFYKKNGFVTFDKHIFKLGAEQQTDLMMKLILKH